MMQLSKEERLLNIDTITNTRDIGGYETQDGHYTKTKRYVRAASPNKLDEEGLKILYDYGVRAQIDLRSEHEINKAPSKLKDYEDIKYYHVNLLQDAGMSVVPDAVKEYNDLSGLYVYIIEACKPKIKEVFDIFLQYPYDTVLYNCSAGKDRTGVITALLLDLVGCHEYDIVKDYSESYENNMAIMKELEALLDDDKKEFLGSKPQYMMKFLAYLKEHYGSAKELLIQCGLTEDEIDEIAENLKI
ncbi:MAG: tyrosine-protein phosphatase [Coprobacillaceae bacterium]